MHSKQLLFCGSQWVITLAIIICVTFSKGLDNRYTEDCGIIGQLHNDQRQRIPWAATFYVNPSPDPEVDTFPAVIISPSLLAASARYFLNPTFDKIIVRNWTSYVAYANITSETDTDISNPDVQAIKITHVRFQPHIAITPEVSNFQWAYYVNNTAFIHLETPIKLGQYAHPLCIPTLETYKNIISLAQNSSTANETTVFFSGWKRYQAEVSIFHYLTVNTPETCEYYWKYSNDNETQLAPYVDRYCANISTNGAHTNCINRDISVVGKINTQEDKYFFLGIVNNFYSDKRVCNSNTRVFVSEPTKSLLTALENNINCGPHNFTCDDGQCVSLNSICNSLKECKDGSDEDITYCDAVLNRYCTEGQYRCETSRKCIDLSMKCNGQVDCEGGDDEEKCPKKPVPIWVIILIAAIFLLVLSGVGFILWKKFFATVGEDLTEKDIESFYFGTRVAETNLSETIIETVENGSKGFGFGKDEYKWKFTLPNSWDAQKFEIPRERLHIEDTKVLGTGAFGIVYKGVLDCVDSCNDVAVKTFKTSESKTAFMSQLAELKIMACLGEHDHIVNLIGAYTKEMRKRILYIVVELCPLGNLRTYLSRNRERFVDVIDREGNVTNSVRNGRISGRNYQQISHNNIIDAKETFNTLDLLLWSFQIASGMEYIASKNINHGDLACRNILLTENYDCKISDFGLSTYLYSKGIFKTKNDETPLPWRWMAIESLLDRQFSTQSDAWSFGVTLWELFSLGQTPYPGITFENIYDHLTKNNERLKEPGFASHEIYEKMYQCWNADPLKRPNFTELKIYFQALYQCLEYVI